MGSLTVLVLSDIFTVPTAVLFGFGCRFVAVPVWADAALGPAAGTVAVIALPLTLTIRLCEPYYQ